MSHTDTEGSSSEGEEDDIIRNIEVSESPPKNDLVPLLECPVCFDLPLPPIRTCSQGHIICASCCAKLESCPLCLQRIGNGRNFFAEDFVNKSIMKCKYKRDGCNVEIPGNLIRKHGLECVYRPLKCRQCGKKVPFSEIDNHLLRKHSIGPWEVNDEGTRIAEWQRLRRTGPNDTRTREEARMVYQLTKWDQLLMASVTLSAFLIMDFYFLEFGFGASETSFGFSMFPKMSL